MSLTARDIAQITRLLEDSSFDELQLEIDGLKIHLRRSGAPAAAAASEPARVSPEAARTPATAASATPAPATVDE